MNKNKLQKYFYWSSSKIETLLLLLSDTDYNFANQLP